MQALVYHGAGKKALAVLDPSDAAAAVAALQAAGHHDARMIGSVQPGAARVVLQTALGGARLLPELEDDPLPRIC